MKDWQTEFFRGIALDFWSSLPLDTEAEVTFLEKALALKGNSRVLDVPCGDGRHSLELAKRGHSLTGVDSSEEYIRRASAASSDISWILGDMRHLSMTPTEPFDAVFCFGNSFGYLDAAEVRLFLSSVAGLLKSGGRFAIDTGMAAESILPNLQRSRWYRFGDIFMLSENRYDARASRLDIDYTFIRGGETSTRPSSSYVLTVNEICRLHEEAGLKPVELLASISGEPYAMGSPRLILVSENEAL